MLNRLFSFSLFLFMITSFLGCEPAHQVKWEDYTPERMNAALDSGKPTVAYFYAAWCGPCMKLKYETFRDERVVAALAHFEKIKVDMSYSRSEKIQKIGAQYGVQGLPTIVFYDAQGKEVNRFGGFMSASRFLNAAQRMSQIQ